MTARRNRDATRMRLLTSARRRFAEGGYDATSLRQVASDAGVDPALIFRYFGSKNALFVAATSPVDPDALIGMPAAEYAESLLDVLAGDDGTESMSAVAALLRSSSASEGGRRLQQTICGPHLTLLGDAAADDDPETRAELVAAWVLGVGVMRAMIPGSRLSTLPLDEIRMHSRRVVAALLHGSGDEHTPASL